MKDKLTLLRSTSLSGLQSFYVEIRKFSSTSSKNSPLIEKISVIIEYFQLFSLTLLLAVPQKEQTSQLFFWADFMVSVSRMINVEDPSKPNSNSNYPFGVIYSVFAFTLLKYALQVYVSLLARKKQKAFGFLFFLWKWMIVLQARIIFFFTIAICINAAHTSKEQFSQSNPSGYQAITVCASIIIAIEYIFSMLIILRFTHKLPNKQYFCSKSTVTDVLTVTLKWILLMVKFFMQDANSLRALITVLISTGFCVINNMFYLKTLPPYKLKAIYIKGCLLAIITSLNLCLLTNYLISLKNEFTFNYNSTLTMWIVMTPVILMLTWKYITNVLTGLDNKFWDSCLPEISIQKLKAMKWMRANLTSNDRQRIKTNVSDLVYIGLGLQPDCGLHTDFIEHLELLITRFPDNEMVKLYVAYYYGIKLRIYVTAIKILRDLERSCSETCYVDSVLLKARIQEAMQNKVSSENRKLDLWKYLRDVETVENTKKEMLTQVKFQLELYNELQKQGPDLGKILEYAGKIEAQKRTIIKRSDVVIRSISSSYVQPLLIYAHYYLTLNYSQLDFVKYNKLYLQKYNKYQTIQAKNRLAQDMLYDKDTAFFILEADGGSDKKIVSCSDSVRRVTGWHSRALVGNHISVILPPIFSSNCFDIVKGVSKEGGGCDLGCEIFESFGYHKNRTLLEFVYYVDIYPILDKGFYLSLVLRRSNSNMNYAIVDNNGNVISVTPKLAGNLGLMPEKLPVNINSVSLELGKGNKACDTVTNMMSSGNNVTREASWPYRQSFLGGSTLTKNVSFPLTNDTGNHFLDPEDAQKIYNKFNSEGVIVTFRPDTYCCKLNYKVYEGVYLKVFSFEKIYERDESSSEQEENLVKAESQASQKVVQEEKYEGTDPVNYVTFNDEQEGGWIDFGKLDTNRTKTHEVLNPPSTTRMMLINETDMPTDEKTTPGKNSNSFSKVTVAKINAKSTRTPRKIEKQSEDQKLDILGSMGSKEAQSSDQCGLDTLISTALDLKYYNPSFTRFIRVFYFMLFTVFCIQFGFHLSMPNNFDVLIARKEITRIAENINDCLIRIQRDARLMLSLYERKLDQNVLSQFNSSIPVLIGKNSDDLNTIILSNHDLVLEIPSLEDGDQREIFKDKISVYDVNANGTQKNVLILDQLQALIKVIEEGSTEVVKARQNVSEALPYLQFIVTNSVNDLLIQGEELSDFFFNVSVREQNTRKQSLDIGFGVVFCFLVLSIFGSCGVLYKQFKYEEENLLKFTRLKVSEIENMQKDINSFKEFIKEDGTLADSSYLLRLQKTKKEKAKVKEDQGISRTNEGKKSVKTRSIQLKYVSYGLKLGIQVIALIILLANIYSLHENTINFSISKLSELHFTERMRARINMGVTAAYELLALNDTNTIRNEPVSIQYREIIEEINSILVQIPDRFADNENPIVENILYNDGCNYMTDPVYYTRCVAVRKGAPSISLTVLISSLETTLSYIENMFYQSNRTSEVLDSIMTNMFSSTVVPNRVVYSLTSLLVSLKNADFESDINNAKVQEDIINSVLDVLFVVVSGLLWFKVFRNVRETDNQMKKVMKAVPKQVVLGHSALKRYLLKTSKGVLEGIKNEI